MSRNLLASVVLSCATLWAASAKAEELALHTFLLTWADENCEEFTYAEDMLRHAHMAVIGAPESEVAAFREKTEAGLKDLFEGDKVEYCAFVADSIADLENEPE